MHLSTLSWFCCMLVYTIQTHARPSSEDPSDKDKISKAVKLDDYQVQGAFSQDTGLDAEDNNERGRALKWLKMSTGEHIHSGHHDEAQNDDASYDMFDQRNYAVIDHSLPEQDTFISNEKVYDSDASVEDADLYETMPLPRTNFRDKTTIVPHSRNDRDVDYLIRGLNMFVDDDKYNNLPQKHLESSSMSGSSLTTNNQPINPETILVEEDYRVEENIDPSMVRHHLLDMFYGQLHDNGHKTPMDKDLVENANINHNTMYNNNKDHFLQESYTERLQLRPRVIPRRDHAKKGFGLKFSPKLTITQSKDSASADLGKPREDDGVPHLTFNYSQIHINEDWPHLITEMDNSTNLLTEHADGSSSNSSHHHSSSSSDHLGRLSLLRIWMRHMSVKQFTWLDLMTSVWVTIGCVMFLAAIALLCQHFIRRHRFSKTQYSPTVKASRNLAGSSSTIYNMDYTLDSLGTLRKKHMCITCFWGFTKCCKPPRRTSPGLSSGSSGSPPSVRSARSATDTSTVVSITDMGTQYENSDAMISSFVNNDLIVELNDRDSTCTSTTEGFEYYSNHPVSGGYVPSHASSSSGGVYDTNHAINHAIAGYRLGSTEF